MPSVRDRFFQMLAQGGEIGSKGALQAQEGELRKFLQADASDRKVAEADAARVKSRTLFDELKSQYPKDGINIDANGGISVQPKEPNPLGLLNLQDRQEARTDRQVREIADRTEKEGIPQMAPALQSAKAKFQGKSVGPLMNMLPTSLQGVAANVRSRAGEMLGKDDWKGSGEEFQELQRLMNIDIRQFAGAAQTQMETAKQMIEKGIQAGGSADQVRRGMEMMQDALNSSARNIEAGSNPNSLQEYRARYGGKSPLEIAQGGAAVAAPPAAEPPGGPEDDEGDFGELWPDKAPGQVDQTPKATPQVQQKGAAGRSSDSTIDPALARRQRLQELRAKAGRKQ